MGETSPWLFNSLSIVPDTVPTILKYQRNLKTEFENGGAALASRISAVSRPSPGPDSDLEDSSTETKARSMVFQLTLDGPKPCTVPTVRGERPSGERERESCFSLEEEEEEKRGAGLRLRPGLGARGRGALPEVAVDAAEARLLLGAQPFQLRFVDTLWTQFRQLARVLCGESRTLAIVTKAKDTSLQPNSKHQRN